VGRTPAWESAYREFFVARQRPLMRTAYAILGSWPAAEDAVQTAFTQLYVHWPRIWWFGTYFVGDDGHFVNAFESVQAWTSRPPRASGSSPTPTSKRWWRTRASRSASPDRGLIRA
jgi:hypothetical protein